MKHAASRLLHRLLEERTAASDAYFTANARAIAVCAAEMAERFWEGGTLLVLGVGAAATDAQHNAVEYVHPVLPGCRALPSIALTDDLVQLTSTPASAQADGLAGLLRVFARRQDIALVLATGSPTPGLARALDEAASRGLLTVALLGGEGADSARAGHTFVAASPDPLIAQELQLATYHMLWELVHIALNHRGIAAHPAPPGEPAPTCITCSDSLCEAIVERVGDDGLTATVRVDGAAQDVSVELLSPVLPGEALLVHGGVALQRAEAPGVEP